MSGRKEPKVKPRLSLAEFNRHLIDMDGICLACHEWTYGGVEPDARGYRCSECHAMKVMGAEDAMLSGNIVIE